MTDCVSREAAVEAALDYRVDVIEDDYDRGYQKAVEDIAKELNSIPAADARPVVTCEECDWHVDIGFHYCNKLCMSCHDNAEFFCAYGERRTE